MFSWILALFGMSKPAVVVCSEAHVLKAVTLLVLAPDNNSPLTIDESILIGKMIKKNWPLSSLVNELRSRRHMPALPADFDWQAYRLDKKGACDD